MDPVDAFFAKMPPPPSRRGPGLRYDWTQSRRFIPDLCAQTGPSALLAVCDRLEDRALGWDTHSRHGLYNDVVEFLAITQGFPQARACVELLARPRALTLPRGVTSAARDSERVVDLSMFQTLEVLERLLAEDSVGRYTDLLARWIQELVVGGVRLDRSPPFARYWEALAHPLARLPLFLYDWEEGLSAHVLRPRGLAKGWPAGRGHCAPIALAGTRAPAMLDTERLPSGGSTARAGARLGTLVQDELPASWSEEVLGDLAGCWSQRDGTLALTPAVIEEAWADLVRVSPGVMRRGASTGRVRDFALLSAADVLRYVFHVVARGGPYDSGEFGPGSRVRAWTLLAEGCGVGATEPLERAAAVSVECQWAAFHVSGFHLLDGWDFGVACVRADGRTLLIKAGTATD